MQPDAVAAAALTYTDAIHTGGQAIAPAFDAEAIHRFRVETKRLRAIIRLAMMQDDELEVKLGRRFKEMYAALGEIRDAQMHLKRVVEKGALLPGFALWLAGRVGEGQRRWLEAYAGKVTSRLHARIAGTVWPGLEPGTLRSFAEAYLSDIEEMLGTPSLDDEVLHDIRKKVKDLQHILRWAQKEWPEGISALEDLETAQVEDIAQRAGDYNDERNAIDTLDEYLREYPGKKGDGEAAAAVRAEWIAARDANREALLRDIIALRAGGDR